MNPKDKGDISEAKILAALVAAGYKVLTPWGDNSRYDLVIEEDGSFSRIQIKTGRLKGKAIGFKTCSVNLRTQVSESYTGQIEYFGVYCAANNGCYLVPIEAVKDCKTEARMRLGNPTKRSYRLAKEFEI